MRNLVNGSAILLVIVLPWCTEAYGQTVLNKGITTSVTSDSTISITAESGNWNAVGATSSSDWDIRMGSTWSNLGSSYCDFVVSNMEFGSASTGGEVERYSGTGGAWVQHANRTNLIAGGSTVNYPWTSTDVLRIWSVYIPATGTRNVTVSGSGTTSDHNWFLFNPGSGTAWRPRSDATYGGQGYSLSSTPIAVNFNTVGTWCLVVCQKNGVGFTPTVSLTVGNVTSGPAQLPNLQLLSIQASVNPAATGSQTVVEVAIRNAGSVASVPCYLDLYYNRQTPPTTGLVGDDYVQISSISANTTIYRTFTVTGPTSPATWTTWAFIDTDDDVQESNENDNVASYTQQWASTAFPNLRVTGMQPSANPATPGSSITVSVYVDNPTPVAVSSFAVEIYHNRATAPGPFDIGTQEVANLSLGAYQSMTVNFTVAGPSSPATWTMWAYVDRTDDVVESDENDNLATGALTWSFSFGSLTLTPIFPSTPHDVPVNRGVKAKVRATASSPGYKYLEWTLDGQLVGEGAPTGTGTMDFTWGAAKAEVVETGRLDLVVFPGSNSLWQGAFVKSKYDQHSYNTTYTIQMKAAKCDPGEGVLSTVTLHNPSEHEISLEIFGDRPELYFSTWQKHTGSNPAWTIYHVRPEGAGFVADIYHEKYVDGMPNGYPLSSMPVTGNLDLFRQNHTSQLLDYAITWAQSAVTLSIKGETVCTIDRTVPTDPCNLFLRAWRPTWAFNKDITQSKTMSVTHVQTNQGFSDDFNFLDLQGTWLRNAGFYEAMKSHNLLLTVWDANNVPATVSWQINTLPPILESNTSSDLSCSTSQAKGCGVLLLVWVLIALIIHKVLRSTRLHPCSAADNVHPIQDISLKCR